MKIITNIPHPPAAAPARQLLDFAAVAGMAHAMAQAWVPTWDPLVQRTIRAYLELYHPEELAEDG